MRISAVVVNWNGGDENLTCLQALRRQSAPPQRIVFVDNASTDGSLGLVRQRFPDVEVVENPENRGYSGGNNAGFGAALEDGAEAVLVLNNDVALDPDVLAALARELEREPDVGIVGPRVCDKRDPARLWAAGGLLTWRQNLTTLLGQGEPDGEAWRATREVDYVPGCAMLVRRAVLERLGGFDERYFAYTEDVDFCLQARAAGWRSVVVGAVRALHASSSSTGGGYNPRRKYMMGVNSVWFLRRHGGPRHWLRFFCFDVVSLPFAWLAGLPRGHGRAVLAKAWGIWRGLRRHEVRAAELEPGASWLW